MISLATITKIPCKKFKVKLDKTLLYETPLLNDALDFRDTFNDWNVLIDARRATKYKQWHPKLKEV